MIFARILGWSFRRPIATLLIAAALAGAAALSASRLRPTASLEPLLPRDDPAASALLRVYRDFRAVDELLVLVSAEADAGTDAALGTAAGAPSPGPSAGERRVARLLDYAVRFSRSLENDPAAKAMAPAARWRAGEEARRFVTETLAPAALYYLDDAEFEAVNRLLSPEGLRAQIRRNEAMIAAPSPAAGALAKAILRDPLRLHERLAGALKRIRPPLRTWQGGDAFVDSDGRSLLIRVPGARPASDLDFTKRFMPAIRRVAEAGGPAGLTVEFAGSYAIAEFSEAAIRGNMIWSIVSSVILLQALFLAVYRRPFGFPLAFAPVAAGILAGFGGYAALSTDLSPLTAVTGAMLAGLGIDYAIHFLSLSGTLRFENGSARASQEEAYARLGRAMGAACVTSIAGFLAIALSRVPALRQFALLGALGLAGAFLASLTLLPAFLALMERARAKRPWGAPGAPGGFAEARFGFEPLADWIGRRTGACLGATTALLAAAVLVLAAAPGRAILLETELAVMHPRPHPPLETQEKITRIFSGTGDPIPILLQAASPAELLALAHRVDRLLAAPRLRALGIERPFGLAALLPDPPEVSRRRAEIGRIDADRAISDFQAAIRESVFDPKAYEAYTAFLRTLLRPPDPPGPEALRGQPDVAGAILPRSAFEPGGPPPTEAITAVFLRQGDTTGAASAAALEAAAGELRAAPGATLTGMTVVGRSAAAAIRADMAKVLGVASAAVLACLLVAFRRPAEALLALVPPVFGIACLLAVMRLAGTRLNLLNLVALPLLAGIGVDAGIFLVSAAARPRGSARETFAATLNAITMTTATSILAFGSLAFTRTPAIRSLGEMLTAGIIGCYVGAVFLLVPLLHLRAARKGPGPGSGSSGGA